MNDPSIVRLAAGCRKLAYLSLGLCTTVKDSGLRALATHCPGLAHLNLFGCAYISERGVAKLVEALGPASLRYLCIRYFTCTVWLMFSSWLLDKIPRLSNVNNRPGVAGAVL